jgi:hypothetical protein
MVVLLLLPEKKIFTEEITMITRELVKTGIDLVEERYLEELYSLIQDFQQLSQPAVTTEMSLWEKLRTVHIQAPADFSVNYEAYLNGEKTIG